MSTLVIRLGKKRYGLFNKNIYPPVLLSHTLPASIQVEFDESSPGHVPANIMPSIAGPSPPNAAGRLTLPPSKGDVAPGQRLPP